MSQLSPAKSTAPSSSDRAYSPLLKAVLGSIDLQLEEELARYRRQRAPKGSSTRSNGRPQTQKTLDLISVRASGGRTQPQQDPAPQPELLSTPAIGTDAFTDRSEVEPPQFDIPDRFPLEHSPGAIASEAGVANSVPLVPSVVHDDYLESSEALQKNLDAPKAPVEPESSFADNLLTPLGIGSMLLLLLSSATLGYVAMNPTSLNHLPFKTLFGQKSSPETKNAALPPSSSADKNGDAGIAQTPNLASKEFVDLNLRSLSGINPKISPVPQPLATPSSQLPVKVPAPLPSPVASSVPIDLPSALLPPSVQSGVLTQPRTQPSVPQKSGQKAAANQATPNPATSNSAKAASKKTEAVARFAPGKQATANQPAAKPTPPKENKFLVVTIYDGDRSLTEVRKVVPDASVRRLRASTAIQISAFPSQAEAQKKVESLRKRGISAQVYRL